MDKQKQPNTLEEINVIKTGRVLGYPYYPVADVLTVGGISFLFHIDFISQPCVLIRPFKENEQFPPSKIILEQIPKKFINLLRVLNLEYESIHNGKSILVKSMDFVLGFNAGYLIRGSFGNSGKGRPRFVITQKFNKDPTYKQSMMSKMSKTIFQSEDWYKLDLQKPVHAFEILNSVQYKFCYLIGKRMFFSQQLKQSIEAECLIGFQVIEWDKIQQGSTVQSTHYQLFASKGPNYQTIKTKSAMMINWAISVPSFTFNHNNELIIADNESNCLKIFDITHSLNLKRIILFDLDVKKMSYYKVNQSNEYLLIMPYVNDLYLLNLTTNKICAFCGHKSYITQAGLTKDGTIVSGGGDHRIGLKKLAGIQNWQKVGGEGHKLVIENQNVEKQKFLQTYFLGVFSNTNSSRNNEYNYGFGNFISFGGQSRLYAYLSYDFCIKIYKILA